MTSTFREMIISIKKKKRGSGSAEIRSPAHSLKSGDDYILLMISSANSEHLISVAPSIKRAKS